MPAVRHKYLDTVTHAALSVSASVFRDYDVTLICNAANAFLCAIPRLVGQKTVLNVDGIERLRRKWNRLGKMFYRLGEVLATELPDRVVTDAVAIQNYYLQEYGFRTEFIPYGAPVEPVESNTDLKALGLEAGNYLLYVSRLEPENNAHLVIRAYRKSGVSVPLVVVGDAPYSGSYIQELRRLAAGSNVLMPGAIYGDGYRELLSHNLGYIHATEVGGTHPALIEAMGAGSLVLVNDTPENREVLDGAGFLYEFNNLESLSQLIRKIWSQPQSFEHYRELARRRVREAYSWEKVTDQYERLFYELIGD